MTNNNPRVSILNDDVLNVSMSAFKNLIGSNSAPNAKFSDKEIGYHLFSASASNTSISNISDVCDDAPSEGAIRYRLSNLESDELQKKLNETLKIHAMETVSKGPKEIAIDLTKIPYYGKEENSGDTIKTKPKDGTSRFFAYATLYLIVNNKRYTLALKYVRKRRSFKRSCRLSTK